MKFLMFATLLTLLSMQGCKNQNILDTLKPGKTASLEDVRHGEFTFSCDVTRDASKMIYMKKSNHQFFRDAQNNMSKARGKWQMRPIRLTGKVFLAPNPIYLKIGESRRDASGVLLEDFHNSHYPAGRRGLQDCALTKRAYRGSIAARLLGSCRVRHDAR